MNALQMIAQADRNRYAALQAEIDAMQAEQRELLAHDQHITGINSKWEAFLNLGREVLAEINASAPTALESFKQDNLQLYEGDLPMLPPVVEAVTVTVTAEPTPNPDAPTTDDVIDAILEEPTTDVVTSLDNPTTEVTAASNDSVTWFADDDEEGKLSDDVLYLVPDRAVTEEDVSQRTKYKLEAVAHYMGLATDGSKAKLVARIVGTRINLRDYTRILRITPHNESRIK